MRKSTYCLGAPMYGLGAVLAGVFAGICAYSIFSNLGHASFIMFLTPFFLLSFFGFLFALSRALIVLQISDTGLRIRNGLGYTALFLDPASKSEIHITRKQDIYLEGSRVIEDSASKNGLGGSYAE
jgi:hypothetical protein